uniref:Lipocalin n=1 Tax=Rhipicephalus appendiculatus TaxID=34631 RepID=A0A131Z185_RHIAP
MASIYLVVAVSFLGSLSLGQEKSAEQESKGQSSRVCNRRNEIEHVCSARGEPYERLCPNMRRRWCNDAGEKICLCARAHFRRLFDDACVPLRDCAKRELVHLTLACFGDEIFMIGASETVFNPHRAKCVRLLHRSRTETGCVRVVMVKERASDYELEEGKHFNGWKHTNYSIDISAEMRGEVPYLRIKQEGRQLLPPEVLPRYPVLHANTWCIITGHYPKLGERTDCFFFVTEHDVHKPDPDCKYIFENYCNSPKIILRKTTSRHCKQ